MHIDKYERTYLIISAAVLGAFFAALLASALIFDVRLPTTTAFINPNTLSETEFANPGLRNRGNGQYDFYIVGQMWRFNTGSTEQDPELGYDIVRIPVGSEVTFNITSRDVTHGVLIEQHNLNIQLVPGHVGRQTVRFNRVGEFFAICHEYCGRAHQNMFFKIVVEESAAADA